jgi:hypothetical protein
MSRYPAADARIADAARDYCAHRLAMSDHAYVDTTEAAICRLDAAWEQLILAYDDENGFADEVVEETADIATIG